MLNLATTGHKVLMVGESTISVDEFIIVQLYGMVYGNIQILSDDATCFIGAVRNIGSVADDAINEEAFLKTTPQWDSEITITAFSSLTISRGK